jgi:hypothetical protein
MEQVVNIPKEEEEEEEFKPFTEVVDIPLTSSIDSLLLRFQYSDSQVNFSIHI